jgi:hypothetical protein
MLVAVVGASAHSGFSLNRLAGVHAAPTAEPAEAPEAADNDNEQGDNDAQGEDNAPAAQPKSSDEHDSGTSGGGDGEHG